MSLFHTHTERVESRIVPVTQKVVHEGMSGDRATQVLQDFESKAQANLVQAFRAQAGDNKLAGTVMVFRDPASIDFEAIAAFTVNGKEFRVRERLERTLDKQEAVRMLVKALSEALISEMLRKNVTSLKQLFGDPK